MERAAVVGVIAGIVSGVGSGLGSGLFAAWFGPGAEARAEQTRLRFAARRKTVDLGRQLVADLQGILDPTAMTHDPTFLRIQPHLEPEVLNFYSAEDGDASPVASENVTSV